MRQRDTTRRNKEGTQPVAIMWFFFIEVVIYVSSDHEVRSAPPAACCCHCARLISAPFLRIVIFNIHGFAFVIWGRQQLKLGRGCILVSGTRHADVRDFSSALHSGRISARWVTQLSKIAVTQFQDQTHSQWETGFEPKGRRRSQVNPPSSTTPTRTSRKTERRKKRGKEVTFDE